MTSIESQNVRTNSSQLVTRNNDLQPGQVTIDQAMDRVGLLGKYQYVLLAYYCLVYTVTSFTFDFVPYILQTPYFIDENGHDIEEIDACKDGNPILASDQDYNIAYKFGLYCDKKDIRTQLESLPFAGVTIGLFLVNYICDNYGRVLSVKFCLSMGLIGTILIMFAPVGQVWLLFVGFFLLGCGFETMGVPIVVHMSEVTTSHFRQISVVFVYVIWGVAEIILLPICLYVRTYQWILVITLIIPCIACLALSFTFANDAPRYYFLRTHKEKAVKVLNQIAVWNKTLGVREDELEEPFISPQQNYDIRDLFRYKSMRTFTIWIFIFFVFIHFLYYGTTFSLEAIGKNYEWNMFYIGIVASFAYSLSDWVCLFFKRKVIMVVTYGIACLTCFSFFWINIPEDCLDSDVSCPIKTLQICLSCFVRFVLAFTFSAMLLLCSEFYPTKLRSTGYGSALAIGFIGSFICPYVVRAAENMSLNPLIALGVISVIGILTIFPLTETFKQELPDEIPELRKKSFRRGSSYASSVFEQKF